MIQNDYLASVGPQRTSAERLAQARVIAGTCSGISGHPEVGAMRFPDRDPRGGRQGNTNPRR